MSRKGNLVERRCATIDRFKMDPFTFKCFAKKIKTSHWLLLTTLTLTDHQLNQWDVTSSLTLFMALTNSCCKFLYRKMFYFALH